MKHFSMRFFLFSLTLLVFLSASAQKATKLNHDLRTYLTEVNSSTIVPLLVEGDQNQLPNLVEQMGGKLRLALPPYYSIELPADQVEAFSRNEAVLNIAFSLSPGQALADTMLIQTRADLVQQLTSPLRENYSGKGVILGVIDSGIEWRHEDFKDSTGKTRILHIWDQGVPYDPIYQAGNYNYGVEWDSSHINSATTLHDDKAIENGHGSNVTGVAASNGRASGNFKGVAPQVNIISVATDFNKPNWLQTVVEATDYIFKKADTLGMPVVINASVGTYLGSHDGLDIAARMIDILIKQKNGRAFVCAAGNAGRFSFHLRQAPQNDTVFTWFEQEPQLFAGAGGVYFELWSDTADFNQMEFAIGADRPVGNSFEFRGRTAFAQAKNRINQLYLDSIISPSGNHLAYVSTFVTESQGRYKMEVAIENPDSSQYRYRLESSGNGVLDVWSSFGILRHSDIVKDNLPTQAQWPAIANYQKPDSLQTIVSSFSSLPSVITVGNYVNRNTYIDVTGTLRNMGKTPGQISENSSLGPNRLGYLKPDLSSSGDYMFAAGRLATIQQAIQSNPAKVSQDSMHFRNGGTSMASPTVAGMVALLLEKCNDLSYQTIKNKLISSIRTDGFTVNLPNPKWGHGKADAHQLLSNEVFFPNLSQQNAILCGNDSLQLSTTQNFQQYLWNQGDSTSQITLKQAGSYYAAVWNNGCRERTDTLNLLAAPLPPKPTITQVQDTLFTNAQGQIQWFRNGLPISSANQNRLILNQQGNYHLRVRDSSTCENFSDTLQILSVDLPQLNPRNTFLSVYPNPSREIVNIQSSDEIEAIALFQLNGKQVLFERPIKGKMIQQLDISEIISGVYLLKITVNQKVYQEPLIIY